MKNILSKEQIIKLGKEIRMYGDCKIRLEDMVECKKFAKQQGFSEYGFDEETYISSLVKNEALILLLNDNK